jgi:peroxiredoxin
VPHAMDRPFGMTAITLSLAIAAGSCATPDERAGAAATHPDVGRTLDRFELPGFEGKPVAWRPDAPDLEGGPPLLLVHVFQPDCLACREEAVALERDRERLASLGVETIGVSHRGGDREAREFAATTGARYPLAVGAGSAWAERWSRGDPTFLVRSDGTIAYAQVGFHPDDAATWLDVATALRRGAEPGATTSRRKPLLEGDPMPPLVLHDLATGAPTSLRSVAGRLVFERDGERKSYRAAVGFFSRYCDFSREEMAALNDLHASYESAGVFVFAISMEPDREAAKSWNVRLGVEYPVFDGHGSQLGERFAYG